MNSRSKTQSESSKPHAGKLVTRSRTLLLFGVAFFGMAIGLLWLDVPISSWARDAGMPGDLRTAVRLSEAFSHGYGALVILLICGWIVRFGKRDWMLSLSLVYLPGLIVNLVKVTVVRRRPGSLLDAFPEHGFESFVGVRPWLSELDLPLIDRTLQSFPSGHTATAVGLAICLSAYFPRGRYWFGGLALLAALQRIDSLAHFPSDTAAGAATACIVGYLLLSRGFGQTTLTQFRLKQHQLALAGLDSNSDNESALRSRLLDSIENETVETAGTSESNKNSQTTNLAGKAPSGLTRSKRHRPNGRMETRKATEFSSEDEGLS